MLLIEKEVGPARHQTGHNSGVIHAGVYYTPGSLKARFCLEGNRATKAFCDEHGITYDECGKLLVATNDLELKRMQALWERTEANGLERYWLSAEELREREPNITGVGGIFVPSSGIVNYAEVAAAMGREFEAAGGEIRYATPVTGLQERITEVVVSTSQGTFSTRYMVSCSGLMADRVVRMLSIEPEFTICPFRGEYYRLPPEHNRIVNHLIYPDSRPVDAVSRRAFDAHDRRQRHGRPQRGTGLEARGLPEDRRLVVRHANHVSPSGHPPSAQGQSAPWAD